MINKFLGSLLHIADPTLPIGGFSHSNGLETYVQNGKVKDTASAEIFIESMLKFNIKFNDASFMRIAYEAAVDNDLEALIRLDEECTALKSPRELRDASQKLGLRFIKIFRRHQEFDLALKYEKSITQGKANGHYAIAFGLYACLMKIPIQETLFAFFYNSCIGMITNSVKLVPLGQLDGQDMMFRFQPKITQLVEETLQLDRSLVGLCNIAFDIRAMQHERLYSRLYMS
jgi:urease accessory protein